MTTAIQKQSMYNIRIEHLELLQRIEDNEGELTPELENTLSLTEEQFQDKAISYGYIYKRFDDNLNIIEAEIDRLTQLKERAKKRKELFKERLADAMKQFGVEKIETPILKLSFRKSESVEITDEDVLPLNYFNIKEVKTANKTLIKEAIKAHHEVPGAELKENKNLQIK